MSVFSKSGKGPDPVSPSQPSSPPMAASEPMAPQRPRSPEGNSVISTEVKIVGNLTSTGDLRIDGTVEGDITSRVLTIGEGAKIDGSITAETVRISGTVGGHIRAGTVAIARTARVTGDVTYRTLSVEEGGAVEGQLRRGEGDKVATLRPVQGGPAAGA
jgi:cytoskeletal protein CcmA (bactofilin family)